MQSLAERQHSRMYREYTWQRDTAGERHHSRMYREYTWQRDTAGRSQSIQTVLLTEHIAHLQRRGPSTLSESSSISLPCVLSVHYAMVSLSSSISLPCLLSVLHVLNPRVDGSGDEPQLFLIQAIFGHSSWSSSSSSNESAVSYLADCFSTAASRE